jgi:hypothetical protein
MAKKLVAAPEGALMRLAASKSVESISALKERTGVDRKTLRAINEGKPVKETTLQKVAVKLRVPPEHLTGEDPADGHEVSVSGDYYHREIALQRLDATALRDLAYRDDINWVLQLDQVSDASEQALKNLREALRAWCFNISQVEDPGVTDNFDQEISRIKTAADIDRCIEGLAQHKLNIYGGDYVRWTKEFSGGEVTYDPYDMYPPQTSPRVLSYRSRHTVVLCVAPDGKHISTIQVATGYEPPKEFDDRKLEGRFDFVQVDGKKVWTRKEAETSSNHDDEIPF